MTLGLGGASVVLHKKKKKSKTHRQGKLQQPDRPSGGGGSPTLLARRGGGVQGGCDTFGADALKIVHQGKNKFSKRVEELGGDEQRTTCTVTPR